MYHLYQLTGFARGRLKEASATGSRTSQITECLSTSLAGAIGSKDEKRQVRLFAVR
jgi:hypothetical protein